MCADTLYDPESYLVAERDSPELKALKPNFQTVDTPPPLASSRESSLGPSSGEDDDDDTGGRKHYSGTKSSLSDGVLLRSLGPNSPDVAKHALKYPIDPEGVYSDINGGPNGTSMTTCASSALTVPLLQAEGSRPPSHDDEVFRMMEDNYERPKTEINTRSTINGYHPHCQAKTAVVKSTIDVKAQWKHYDTRPPSSPPTSPKKPENEVLSPALAKLKTHGSEHDKLTPLQRSPPRSHNNGSPEPNRNLPSLHTALSMEGGSPFPRSPSVLRASPSHFGQTSSTHSYGSPYTVMSPPTTTNPAAWRSNMSGSASTPSDYAGMSASTQTSMSTPSSLPVMSPHYLPIPNSAISESADDEAQDENRLLHKQEEVDIHGVDGIDSFNGATDNGLHTNGNFVCTVKGCTAASFSTQYLLTSHMNVHTDSRPHFCMEPGCPRGPNGQGFKRKNEMIRHGLVHKSPGYMCPFCPDQQHRYPRPDNLQRHVKVHHVDKDRDDPMLRDVLAQRAEGGNRGRRRRLGS